VPKAGEILVEVEAISLNYRDAEVADNGMGIIFPFHPRQHPTWREGSLPSVKTSRAFPWPTESSRSAS
jgi:NADPH:quinone reductase-like Zn-dependent oxidoreductase